MKKILTIFILALLTCSLFGQSTWPKQRTKVSFLDSTYFWKGIMLNGATSGHIFIRGYDIGEGVILVPSSASQDTLATQAYARTYGGEGATMQWPGSGMAVSTGSAWGASVTNNSANWNTAYADRLKWDGGSTGLVAATGRTSLGATTVGSNLFTLANPSNINFLRINADNSVSALSSALFKTSLGLNYVTNESKATMLNNMICTGSHVIPSPFTLGATSVTTTGAQLNYLNIAAGTTGTGNLVLSNNPIIGGHPTFEGVTSTGVTGTGNLVYSISPELTGDVVLPATTDIGTVSDTEIGYVDGVTDNIQDQIDTKAPIHDADLTGTTDITTLQVGDASSNTKAEIDSMSLVGDEIADFIGPDTIKRYIPYANRTQLTDVTGITWMYFKVDSTAFAPEDGDSLFTDSRFIDKEIKFWRSEDTASGLKLQVVQNWADGATYGYEFDDETGEIITHPPLISKERVRIEAYNTENRTEISPALQLCAEYQPYYDALDIKPRADSALMQNAMIEALADGGYWDGPNVYMEFFYFLAQRSTAGAKINVVNPGTYDASDATSTTHIKYQGFDFDGSTNYFTTGYNPYVNHDNISINSTTIAAYVLSDINTADFPLGCSDGSYDLRMCPRSGGNLNALLNDNTAIIVANATSAGLSMATRRASDDIEAYMNGVSLGSDTDVSNDLPNAELYLGAYNNNGSPLAYFDGIISIIFGCTALDAEDTYAAAINTIIETCMDAMGIGVEE